MASIIKTEKIMFFFMVFILLAGLHECMENIPRRSIEHKTMMKTSGQNDATTSSANLLCIEQICPNLLPCWCCTKQMFGCYPIETMCQSVCKA
ncbi:hypothetical protein MKW94_001179 [Papaver nudicaule]|uniref:Uncharacterized protein n=1 Tax=Papaver nudicaule TaxID=74823 RepID=A0AA41S6I8_PAPNU|nr:hypothetical protein [Papaver nudicaule]